MNAHTKAPWRLTNGEGTIVNTDYSSPGYYENLHITGADGRTVVGCDEYDVFGYGTSRTPDLVLLLAAPEMAAMLRECRKTFCRAYSQELLDRLDALLARLPGP